MYTCCFNILYQQKIEIYRNIDTKYVPPVPRVISDACSCWDFSMKRREVKFNQFSHEKKNDWEKSLFHISFCFFPWLAKWRCVVDTNKLHFDICKKVEFYPRENRNITRIAGTIQSESFGKNIFTKIFKMGPETFTTEQQKVEWTKGSNS